MKNVNTWLSAAALIGGLAGPAPAKTTNQTVTLNEVATIILAPKWRATAIFSAEIYNEAGEEIGNLEDMIITSKETVSRVVVLVDATKVRY